MATRISHPPKAVGESVPAKRKNRGRPSSFTPEKAARVLAAIPFADGGLEEICAQEGMPGPSTVYRWLESNQDFREKYARARELAGEVQAQRSLREALEAEDAQIGRLRWDARRWTASKLAPKKYGDKVQQEISGPDGGPLTFARIERVILDGPEALRELEPPKSGNDVG